MFLFKSDLIVVKCICLWFALYRITIIFFGGELLSINHAMGSMLQNVLKINDQKFKKGLHLQ